MSNETDPEERGMEFVIYACPGFVERSSS